MDKYMGDLYKKLDDNARSVASRFDDLESKMQALDNIPLLTSRVEETEAGLVDGRQKLNQLSNEFRTADERNRLSDALHSKINSL